MPRGGARPFPGPNPDLKALARVRDYKTFTRLPRECTRPAPDWPVEVCPNPTNEELQLWETLWRKPQAHVWHADHTMESVALYARQLAEAGKPRASAVLRTNVRQQADTLLLSTGSLNAAKLVIVDSPEDEILKEAEAASLAQSQTPRPGDSERRSSARSRMRVIDINKAAGGSQ